MCLFLRKETLSKQLTRPNFVYTFSNKKALIGAKKMKKNVFDKKVPLMKNRHI